MLKVKQILNDLVDYTYPDSDKKEEYKRFYVEMINKDMKSRHGDYHELTHHIRIFNLYRDDAAIIATTIHELAHHVQLMKEGATNHGAGFYVVFQELLHKALDMNLFSKAEFLKANRDASDSNKIAKMIENYSPSEEEYKADVRNIEVKNGFEKKDILKERGYRWNTVNKVWEREVSLFDLGPEIAFLDEEKLEYDVNKATDISFRKKTYIIASKGAFDVKDQLREDGFSYLKAKKVWRKEGTHEELAEYSGKYPNVSFTIE